MTIETIDIDIMGSVVIALSIVFSTLIYKYIDVYTKWAIQKTVLREELDTALDHAERIKKKLRLESSHEQR